jgi:hypothetical protein
VSLPARQQRTLDRIERRLAVSDPGLLALFAIFTRLTLNEDMPHLEEVRARLARLGGWFARITAPVRRRIPRPSDRVKTAVFFPAAALAAVACSLALGASAPAMHRCAMSIRTPAAELMVKGRQCRLTLVRSPVQVFAH